MKIITGKVVSIAMKNTVVVEREIARPHKLYKKIIRKNRRLKAHTDMGVGIGDYVEVSETRPLSRDVHFKVTKKINAKT